MGGGDQVPGVGGVVTKSQLGGRGRGVVTKSRVGGGE